MKSKLLKVLIVFFFFFFLGIVAYNISEIIRGKDCDIGVVFHTMIVPGNSTLFEMKIGDK